MNLAAKSSSLIGAHSAAAATPCSLRAACSFHSTPFVERKRRTHWNSGGGSYKPKRFNSYTQRMSRLDSKRTLLRDVSDFAEYLFESWNDEDGRATAWFRRQHWSKGAQVDGFSSHEPQWGSSRNKRKGGFDFSSSDDDGVETIFRSTFGGQRPAYRGERSAFRGEGYYYWSFNNSDNFQWRYSSGKANHRSSWDWRDESDYEEEETNSSPRSNLAPERLALGLNASGPLKLEEVKNAYRTCALRWHPDRHQGSSKVAAEEKFKHCSAAYKTLCDNLAIN
ncbi:uncharacterized protein M6B38_206340 [Iris pallida]|uniref:J domain-containing protein n=1 Tax=Iris pallida TaxID=29817 RepID=A0AAX6E6A2_IRIPA|nr:uncharacterized protein M6B38_206340 [Iris pallida]